MPKLRQVKKERNLNTKNRGGWDNPTLAITIKRIKVVMKGSKKHMQGCPVHKMVAGYFPQTQIFLSFLSFVSQQSAKEKQNLTYFYHWLICMPICLYNPFLLWEGEWSTCSDILPWLPGIRMMKCTGLWNLNDSSCAPLTLSGCQSSYFEFTSGYL